MQARFVTKLEPARTLDCSRATQREETYFRRY